MNQRRSWFLPACLVAGFAFLYVPILSLIIFSFNASKLVTVWGGFSTKWYGALLGNRQILDAAWLSVRIAAMNATLAVILGTMVALVLTRLGPFRGRALLSGMATAPLVMPEVITGLSMLLLFVSLEQWFGWPQGRGITTIVIAIGACSFFALTAPAIAIDADTPQTDPPAPSTAHKRRSRPSRLPVK